MRSPVPLYITILLALLLSGCAPKASLFRADAAAAAARLTNPAYSTKFPVEVTDFSAAYALGEQELLKGNIDDADNLFRFASLKAMVIEERFLEQTRLQADEERRIQDEQLKAAAELAARKRLEEEQAAESAREAARKSAEAAKKRVEKPRTQALVARYTVRRGETLPQISAQPEVYGDSSLWTLIYRANRDQISDPAVLWPGQTLRIPRN